MSDMPLINTKFEHMEEKIDDVKTLINHVLSEQKLIRAEISLAKLQNEKLNTKIEVHKAKSGVWGMIGGAIAVGLQFIAKSLL